MAKRTEREESTHHRKVRELARQLKKQDYEVRADGVRGYKRPRPIGKARRIPDIEAKKGSSRVIVEVETPRSRTWDKEQLKTFTRHAAQKKGTKFHVVVTKPRKGK
ncbi:hypothetical protein ES703_61538 [subsurface metagenome]